MTSCLLVVLAVIIHCICCHVVGENIDGRVCETLEEVFRRVQFKTVDIEATSLDEEVSTCFFAVLYM